MNPSEFQSIFAMIRGAYPSQVVTQDTTTAYWLCLKDLPYQDARDAVLRHLRTSPYWPSIADIAQGAARAKIGPSDPESTLSEIRSAVRTYGYAAKNRPRLSDVAEAVVEVIGWDNICASENPEALRAHILRIASTVRDRAVETGNLASVGLAPASPCPMLPESIGDILKRALPDRSTTERERDLAKAAATETPRAGPPDA